MLTRYQTQSELSLAYLHAVAAKVGFAVNIPHPDMDSVDAEVSAAGKIDATSIQHSPRIEIQLKATINFTINSNNEIPFSLDLKNYNDLRVNTMIPRLLVVFCMPRDNNEWLKHSEEELTLKKCAYYLNLKGMPESNNSGSQTVYVPIANVLSPETLHQLMIKVSKMEDL